MTTTAPTAPRLAGRREWTGLAVLALPVLLLAIDNSVLFLALPQLSADLQPTTTEQLWIMDSYGFMTAGFLITMGSLGDRIGRRKLLVIGAVGFGLASVLAAYSASPEMLIVTRALLGITGAALMPSALALISVMFSDPKQRGFAIGVFVACFMGGGALGPFVGGTLLESFWWGSVFLLGVPVMVLLLATAPFLLPETRDPAAGRIDPASVVLSLAAILPVIYGLKEIADQGPKLFSVLITLIGAGFGWLFVARQRRLNGGTGTRTPLLDVGLFGNRSFRAAVLILIAGMIVQGGIYLVVGQHLQAVLGMSPLTAGAWLMIPAIALAVGSLLTPVLTRRFRPGSVVGAGLVISAAGFVVLATADPHSGFPVLMTAITVGFAGAAPLGAVGLDLIVGAAPAERAGSASSVGESSGEFGIALGVATLGSVSAAVYRQEFTDSAPASVPPDTLAVAEETISGALAAAAHLPGGTAAELVHAAQQAFGTGLQVVAMVCAVISAAVAVLAVTALRHVRPTGSGDAE